MKYIAPFLFALVLLMSSCSMTESYYQLYKTESVASGNDSTTTIQETDDMRVTYDLWTNEGSSSFVVYNKTDRNLYVDLSNTHIIVNGFATTYFQNRSVTTSYSSSYGTKSANYAFTGYVASTETAASSDTYGSSILYNEQELICIPANSAKRIYGFALISSLYRDCDLLRYPSRKRIKTKSFNLDSSPIKFRFVIPYGFNKDKNMTLSKIEKEYWVSEITNYPSNEFYDHVYPVYCGERSNSSRRKYLHKEVDRFYIRYTKGSVDLRH